MSDTAWAYLPNAKHIDAVLADARKRPGAWDAAWGAAWDAAQRAVWDAAQRAAWDAAQRAAWDAAQRAAWDAVRDAVWDAAWDTAWGALAALIAWDSSADLLECTPDMRHRNVVGINVIDGPDPDRFRSQMRHDLMAV